MFGCGRTKERKERKEAKRSEKRKKETKRDEKKQKEAIRRLLSKRIVRLSETLRTFFFKIVKIDLF